MNILNEAHYRESEYNTRRHFIKNCISGMGALTLGSMLGGDLFANNSPALNAGGESHIFCLKLSM